MTHEKSISLLLCAIALTACTPLQQEIRFTNGNVSLAGTIILPIAITDSLVVSIDTSRMESLGVIGDPTLVPGCSSLRHQFVA